MTSTPPTNASPDVGITRVVSMPAVVVLPAPLGPSNPKISPRCTSSVSASTAGRSIPAYCLVRSMVRMTTSSGGITGVPTTASCLYHYNYLRLRSPPMTEDELRAIDDFIEYVETVARTPFQ